MYWNDNEAFLARKFPQVLQFLKDKRSIFEQEPIEVITSKSGQPIIQIRTNEKILSFHSQYDPIFEAKKIIEKYADELQKAKHVLFYGFGFGYHVEQIVEQYPEINYSVFDPFPVVFGECMKYRSYRQVGLHKAINIYLDNLADFYMNHFASQGLGDVIIIPHPTYERIFSTHYKTFLEKFRTQLQEQRLSIGVNNYFQRLWTVNSMANFSKVMRTPSIIGTKKKYFEGKPAVIVSAGPSLEEEYERLKKIKENGLAYIIAVGSANKALINQGIYPDAICTYDPSTVNHLVFQEIIDQKIENIPLIFGSSVGLQTLELYPGPKLHMITSQDSISNFLIGEERLYQQFGNQVVLDAPSVAIIALEVLNKLECSEVILVGQNFAYKNNKYYTSGVSYSDRSTELTTHDLETVIEIESVDGGKVITSAAHNSSRMAMEQYITTMNSKIMIYNTTTNGAKIKGAEFIALEDVINRFLHERIVESNWFEIEDESDYDFTYIIEKMKILEKDFEDLDKLVIDIVRAVKKLETVALLRHNAQVQKLIEKFNRYNQRLYDNQYYKVCLQPMVRLEYAMLQKDLGKIQKETDVFEKANLIINIFGSYIYSCQLAMRDTSVFFKLLVSTFEKSEEAEIKQGAF
ncbi:motility associated factor glycosyltransferase family protein [Paenibacillus andongensis]|uniref:motility associated factor glycosyltransferase family protein n=1 Tax=Paenibacillus andongensis TaxID=2975482 RepID=UPI0021BAC701|nr:6-hydroxymethylpterin diphosphokinase MptE-like protein [Paenibacillus andongensis]